MKVRSLLLGLVGGVVGTALVFVVLFLLGFADVGKDDSTPTPTATVTTSSTSSGDGGLTAAQIYEQSKRGVVEVISTFDVSSSDYGMPFDTSQSSQALGSGFVVSSDGYILTNAHVIEEDDVRATSVEVLFKGDGTSSDQVEAEVVGLDLDSDVAVLKIDADKVKRGITALPLGDSEDVTVGEEVIAIGNPLGYDFSVTSGIVSAVDRNLESPVEGVIIPNGIQTDAAINQGNSGGPLLDVEGNVIGINEQIASQSGGSQGLGFAVPINTAVRSYEQIKEYGEVRYAWMGIQGQTITSDVASALNLSVDQGVLLADVVSGGPADDAGLKGGTSQTTIQDQTYIVGGDIITKIDGKAMPSMEELIAYIDERDPGDKVKVTYVRDGKSKTVKLTLEQRPEDM